MNGARKSTWMTPKVSGKAGPKWFNIFADQSLKYIERIGPILKNFSINISDCEVLRYIIEETGNSSFNS